MSVLDVREWIPGSSNQRWKEWTDEEEVSDMKRQK